MMILLFTKAGRNSVPKRWKRLTILQDKPYHTKIYRKQFTPIMFARNAATFDGFYMVMGLAVAKLADIL